MNFRLAGAAGAAARTGPVSVLACIATTVMVARAAAELRHPYPNGLHRRRTARACRWEVQPQAAFVLQSACVPADASGRRHDPAVSRTMNTRPGSMVTPKAAKPTGKKSTLSCMKQASSHHALAAASAVGCSPSALG